jgi:uncharacterized DUF497 family protein
VDRPRGFAQSIVFLFGAFFTLFWGKIATRWYRNRSLQPIETGYVVAVPFEFDPAKSASAKADPNRGIDFDEVQVLWLDPSRIEVPLPFAEEPRLAVIGKIGPKIWTAIVTQRGENIRIISVRRAHPKEEKIYEQG